jgi:hypothetical protein
MMMLPARPSILIALSSRLAQKRELVGQYHDRIADSASMELTSRPIALYAVTISVLGSVSLG